MYLLHWDFIRYVPAAIEYVMGAPYFKKATITLENGKKLEISAPKNNDDNRYIRSLNYNGKNYIKELSEPFRSVERRSSGV